MYLSGYKGYDICSLFVITIFKYKKFKTKKLYLSEQDVKNRTDNRM